MSESPLPANTSESSAPKLLKTTLYGFPVAIKFCLMEISLLPEIWHYDSGWRFSWLGFLVAKA